jgi:hypothetical protein
MLRLGDLIITGDGASPSEWFGRAVSKDEQDVLIQWIKGPIDFNPEMNSNLMRCPTSALSLIQEGRWRAPMDALEPLP